MRRHITYNELLIIEQDIRSIKIEKPGLAFLLTPRINFFYERAGIHLKAMANAINNIKQKFIETDSNGEFLKTGEGEKQEWKWLPEYKETASADPITDAEQIR